MLSLPALILLCIAPVALLLAFLMGLNAWEFRRRIGSRLREQETKQGAHSNRTAVIVPVKGCDDDLRANLSQIFDQTHPNYEVVFVVETDDDPAVPVLKELLVSQQTVNSRIVVAGLATDTGQKIHNLRQAVRTLDEDVEMLVFMDADACPGREWLSVLTKRTNTEDFGAATAYRWFIPERNKLANLVLCSINSAVAGLFGRHRFNLVWGGSWAIWRRDFYAIGLPQAWDGTLSDDLVASRQLKQAKRYIEFESSCVVASPIDMNWRQVLEFLRRQFLIGRQYVGKYWLMSLAYGVLMHTSFWGNFIAAAWLAMQGNPLAIAHGLATLLLYGMSAGRAWLRQDGARQLFPQHAKKLAASRQFDIWAGPFVGLITVGAMVSSALGNCITWRGNRYRIHKGGKIELLNPPSRARAESSAQRAELSPTEEPRRAA